jgi:hypothetical protein
MLEYSAQLVGLWFEMAQKVWPSTPTAPTRPEPPGAFDFVAPRTDATAAPASGETTRASEAPTVVLAVESRAPVEVTVELRPGCRGKELDAFDLRAARDEAPRIRDVKLEWIEDRVRVSIRVPEGQPPGNYTSVVVDAETNLPFGTITLSVANS